MPDSENSSKDKSPKIIKNYSDLIETKRLFPKMDNKQIATRVDMTLPTLYRAYRELSDPEVKVFTPDNSLNSTFASFLGISIGASICKVVIIDMTFEQFDDERIRKYLSSVRDKLLDILPKDKRNLLGKCKTNIDDPKKVTKYIYFDTPEKFSDLKNCIDCIITEALLAEYDFKIKGVGISTTGLVDQINNEIVTASNLKYLEKQDIDTLLYPECRDKLEEEKIKISLIQNTNASLLHEIIKIYKSDSTKINLKNVASLYLGVGLGVGLCLNGRLYYVANGYAGEIGHIPALPFENELSDYKNIKDDKTKGDEFCTCGRETCYDHKIRKYVFRISASDFKEKSTDEIKDMILSDSIHGNERLKLLGKYLGGIISYLINTLNLDAIVLSGKLYKFKEDRELLDYINMALDDYCIAASRKECDIIFSESGTLSPAQGAAIYSYYDHYGITPDWD